MDTVLSHSLHMDTVLSQLLTLERSKLNHYYKESGLYKYEGRSEINASYLFQWKIQ